MTFNEILSKQNVLNALLLKDGDNELSKELKVKIVRLRIAFSAIRKTFDEALQEFVKELAPERFKKHPAEINSKIKFEYFIRF